MLAALSCPLANPVCAPTGCGPYATSTVPHSEWTSRGQIGGEVNLRLPWVAVLGGLRLNGERPDLAPLARRFLTTLAISTTRVVTGEEINVALWGEQGYDKPPNAARRYKRDVELALQHHLRTGATLVQSATPAGAYVLEVSEDQVDVFVYRKLVRSGDRAAQDLRPIDALRCYANAIALYPRGQSDLLIDLRDWETGDQLSAEIQALHVRVLEKYFSLLLEQGGASQAVPLLRAQVHQHALSAGLRAALIAALTLDGQADLARRERMQAEIDLLDTGYPLPNVLGEASISDLVSSLPPDPTGDLPDDVIYANVELAPDSPRVAHGNGGELSQSSSSARRVTTDVVIEELRRTTDQLSRRRLPGSKLLRLIDLLDDEELLMDADASSDGENISLLDTIESAAEHKEALGRTQKILVTGVAGVGKSTIAELSYVKVAKRAITHDARLVPFLIDLRAHLHERNNEAFGSNLWLQSLLHDALFSDSMSVHWTGMQSARDRNPESVEVSAFIILDSVDEFCASLSPDRVNTIVELPLFALADVIFTRTDFYRSYLEHANIASQSTTADLQAWSLSKTRRYVTAFYAHVSRPPAVGSAFLRRLDVSKALQAVCSVPIRLNMSLELHDTADAGLPAYIDSSILYGNYVHTLLGIEAAKAGSCLTRERKIRFLRSIAWAFYDEGTIVEEESPVFGVGELRALIKASPERQSTDSVDDLVLDLRYRTILASPPLANLAAAGAIDSVLQFEHKSFHEYLVADYIVDALAEGQEPPVEVFERYLSPAVAEFLKEKLKALTHQPRLSRRACAAMGSLIELASTRDGPALSRIAREQIYYFSGSLTSKDLTEQLTIAYQSETDEFLKRGLAIGLAYSGYDSPMMEYVQALRAERDRGGGRLNAQNIAVQLPYFGDAPFDPARPEGPEHVSTVSRMTARLVYQLQTDTDRPSWRIDLYSLVHLAGMDGIAGQSYLSALMEVRSLLPDLVARLEDDPLSASWPEVAELRAVLSSHDLV